jgi:hypothetical protein
MWDSGRYSPPPDVMFAGEPADARAHLGSRSAWSALDGSCQDAVQTRRPHVALTDCGGGAWRCLAPSDANPRIFSSLGRLQQRVGDTATPSTLGLA